MGCWGSYVLFRPDPNLCSLRLLSPGTHQAGRASTTSSGVTDLPATTFAMVTNVHVPPPASPLQGHWLRDVLGTEQLGGRVGGTRAEGHPRDLRGFLIRVNLMEGHLVVSP